MEQKQLRAVAAFTCLGDRCEDTCCQGWGMQLNREHVAKYNAEAPELLDAVTSGEAEHIMKRDPATDYCVKFEGGWCGIQRQYGADFLGDACFFFPRITRAFGEQVLTGAALSCPEAARLMLLQDDGFGWVPRDAGRLPFSLKDYAPAAMPAADAFAVHDLFLREAGNEAYSAEMNMMRLSAIAQALEHQPPAQWMQAAGFYARMAEGRVPAAEAVATDPFNLAHALVGLVGAATTGHRPRLQQTIDTLLDALGMQVQGVEVQLAPDAAQRFLRLLARWRQLPDLQPVMRRYLQAQMSVACFPFAGLGHALAERIAIIGVRFATVKLALMAEAHKQGGMPDDASIVRVVQSLSRFLDHLADPTFSLRIYQEAGWTREPRLRGLLME